jgi:hypothetical protein
MVANTVPDNQSHHHRHFQLSFLGQKGKWKHQRNQCSFPYGVAGCCKKDHDVAACDRLRENFQQLNTAANMIFHRVKVFVILVIINFLDIRLVSLGSLQRGRWVLPLIWSSGSITWMMNLATH